MNGDEIFERWMQQRRETELKPDFSRRVMDRIDSPGQSFTSRWLAAAIVLLAVSSAAIHLAVVLVFTLTDFNKGN